jgi:hypothetical protein
MSEQPLPLPKTADLLASLSELAERVEPISRCKVALETGQFTHPDGRTEDLGLERLGLEQAALLSHLCRRCPSPLSLEVGFGMGSSAAIILGTRSAFSECFEHLIYDPYGLPNGRGSVVQSYLEAHFGERFQRIRTASEIALGQLLNERGRGCAGLVFIDGGHHFENVMTDFVLADKLCCESGYIMFDDTWFPAIESVINYVRANRPDYAVAHWPVGNASVLRKLCPDSRPWSSFKPFEVPNRFDWEPIAKSSRRTQSH